MSQYTIILDAGLHMGEVEGDIFCKKVRSSVHFLQKPPVICLGVESLRYAMDAGAQWVHILDKDTGITYKTHVDTVCIRSKRIDRRHGKQYALALSNWQVDNPRITHNQLSLLVGVGG